VAAGDLVAVMEAMKMETQVKASQAGRVRFKVAPSSFLQAGAEIARLEASEPVINDD
jgi:acetyl-CoA/propionyl-CoA carboxylase biotin carboxyl carrier protein